MQKIAHRTIVSLVRKEYITPNFLRIILHCDDIEHYEETPFGVNNKLFIPPQGVSEVIMPIFNPETKLWEIEDEARKASVRTYTHRAIDLEKKELTVDFAVHDGDSVACNWARVSKPGDKIGLAMKLKHRDVFPEGVEEFLFVTDMTGIPVVASLIKTLPATAKATIITEVLSDADILDAHYESPATLNTKWLVNPHPEQGSELAEHGKKAWATLQGTHFTHVTAEYSVVKSLRDFLRHENELSSKEFYACAYWQINKREDEEREKRLD